MAVPDTSPIVAIGSVPSLKVTVPVAVDGVTVAVKVTTWLKLDGFGDEASAVLLMIWLTVWATTDEVLVVSPASPL
jgi:hypothetical protein